MPLIENVHTWLTEDGIIYLNKGGERIELSAESIYSLVFEGKAHNDITSEDLIALESGIEFSKYPAQLKIVLSSSAESNDYVLRLNIYAFNEENQRYPIPWNKFKDHLILGNTWYPFDRENIIEIKGILSKIELESPGTISLGQYLKLLKLSSEFLQDEVRSFSLADLPQIDDKPDGLKAVLYQYQTRGWHWLRFSCNENVGCILADEMGLGKTIQIISIFCSEYKKDVFPSLIISPSTLLENWRREFEKFAPHIKTVIHQGPQRTGFPKELLAFDIILTSYETVVRDSSLFGQIDWRLIVCDEAQAIKNPEAKRTIAVKRLPRKSGIAVTGTPVENSLLDLWSILDFAVPGFLGSKVDFEKKFVNEVGGASILEKIISPLILRRRVADVANDLPPKIIIPQALNLSDEEINAYEIVRAQTESDFSSNTSLAVLNKLRMYCTHPFLIENNGGDPAQYSNKYIRLIEIAEEIIANNAKMILFTSYNLMNDIIRNDFLHRFGIFAASIDGRTPVSDRQKMVDEFSATSGSGILVLNPVAAGTGLNITSANHVIHYNLEWNPAKEDQASARAYRRGQSLPVTIHRLFYVDTVEEAINERLDRKRELAETAIVGVSGDAEDYQDILNAIKKSPRKG